MKIEEAIEHCEEKAREMRLPVLTQNSNGEWVQIPKEDCEECAKEHEQLSEWMKELKRLREEERPTGKWIRQGKGDDYRCDKCGCSAMYFSQLDDGQEVFGTLTTDWCPWCGAKMEEDGVVKEAENDR